MESMGEMATWWSTFGICIVSALVPLVNAELVLLGAVAYAPREMAIPLAGAAALGQMVGKVVMYFVGRGALRLPGQRVRRVMAQAEAKLKDRQGMENAIYCTSAFLGIPPYYLVAVTSGMVHYPLPRFVVLGLLGRFARFATLVSIPGLLKGWHLP
jgi:membrane protein YqaA with SNARE-associated domain